MPEGSARAGRFAYHLEEQEPLALPAPRAMILLDPDLDMYPANSGTASGKLPSTRTLARFLAQAQAAVRLRGQVAVLLTTDAAIRRLNRQFLGKNKPTDVLSFPAEPVPGLRAAQPPAGDVAISVETARRQRAAYGHSLGTELKVLILHGLLHLAGYDHETDTGRMARRERALRARLGLPVGLIERAADKTSTKAKPVIPSAGRWRTRTTGVESSAVRNFVQATTLPSPTLSAASGGKGGKARSRPRANTARSRRP